MSVAAMRKLYCNTSKATVQKDRTKGIAWLKALTSEDDREKAAVFMDGLSQMRSEWGVRPRGSAD